ncbi:Cytochrome c1 precursor [Candidatus Bealeia paramacronuclearis]|uniref:Cytochrome c1 n=1 Tax=Candidatus Bealeia paramacronuclearis TaxID=1921001 RepID=A0ABZ2C4B1_9PROT|nr:Cytochrome c1 precursor [Candidatus Bealeia paramacronuclearis]
MNWNFLAPIFVYFLLISSPILANEEARPLPDHKWTFEGAFGTFDLASLQKGFQIYKQVCSACHSIKRIHFRNLSALGYNEAEIKAIASDYEVTDGPNDLGEMFTRKGTPADAIPGPYANDKAARAANNGALPPDLSLVVKARKGGADYIFALLTGYENPPAGKHIPQGMHYNPYFPGEQIAMTPPLSEGLITHSDGTTPTVQQMAHDVVNFLTWAAEPEMVERKQMGLKVLFYLSIFTLLMYFVMRRVWARVK